MKKSAIMSSMRMVKHRSIVVLFLCLVFFPTCYGREKIKILICMTTSQKNFFMREIIVPFEKKNKVRVKVL